MKEIKYIKIKLNLKGTKTVKSQIGLKFKEMLLNIDK